MNTYRSKTSTLRTWVHRNQLAMGLALAAVCWVSCAREEQHHTILRLAHSLDTHHPVHIALEHLASEVDRLSEGSLTVTVYPNEQLGSERELVELLQMGSLSMTKISASVLENFAPDFAVLGVPYLFKDRQHQFSVLDGKAGSELLASLAKWRLRGLGFYDAGSRSFYTCKRSVASPADLEGLKIRTQESSSAMDMVKALGANPTPIAWGELYTALSQGVVDGAENNPPSFYSSRHYEVCPHFTLDRHTAVPDVLVISETVWERLTPSQQDLLRTAVRSSIRLQRQLWQQATAEALRQLKAKGVEIIRPNTRAFRERVASLRRRAATKPTQRRFLELVSDLAEGNE